MLDSKSKRFIWQISVWCLSHVKYDMLNRIVKVSPLPQIVKHTHVHTHYKIFQRLVHGR